MIRQKKYPHTPFMIFSKSQLVQNIGWCGNSQLPTAQLRKPQGKANLERKKCICLKWKPKKKIKKGGIWSLIGDHPSGLKCFPGEKMLSVSSLIYSSTPVDASFFSFLVSLPPLANDHCEQMEADFPSVSDRGIAIAGWGVGCRQMRKPAKNPDSSRCHFLKHWLLSRPGLPSFFLL